MDELEIQLAQMAARNAKPLEQTPLVDLFPMVSRILCCRRRRKAKIFVQEMDPEVEKKLNERTNDFYTTQRTLSKFSKMPTFRPGVTEKDLKQSGVLPTSSLESSEPLLSKNLSKAFNSNFQETVGTRSRVDQPKIMHSPTQKLGLGAAAGRGSELRHDTRTVSYMTKAVSNLTQGRSNLDFADVQTQKKELEQNLREKTTLLKYNLSPLLSFGLDQYAFFAYILFVIKLFLPTSLVQVGYYFIESHLYDLYKRYEDLLPNGPKEELYELRKEMVTPLLLLACSTMWLFFVLAILQFQHTRQGKLVTKIYAAHFVTPSDYTAQVHLTQKQVRRFINQRYRPEIKKSFAQQLQESIEEEFLSEVAFHYVRHLKKNPNDSSFCSSLRQMTAQQLKEKFFKVAIARFTLDDRSVILDLKKRGSLIKRRDLNLGNYHANTVLREIEKVNERINDRIQAYREDEPSKSRTLASPCSLFLTFETIVAAKFVQKCFYSQFIISRMIWPRYTFMGESLRVTKCEEPESIIFENQRFRFCQFFWRLFACNILGYVLLILGISLYSEESSTSSQHGIDPSGYLMQIGQYCLFWVCRKLAIATMNFPQFGTYSMQETTVTLVILIFSFVQFSATQIETIYRHDLDPQDFDFFKEIAYSFKIIVTYTILPILEFVLFFVYTQAKRALDQGKLFPDAYPSTTKKATMAQYYELYAGPAFDKGWKYSLIFMITFQSLVIFKSYFIFLFVMLSLVILYLWQKLVRTKFYRKSRHRKKKGVVSPFQKYILALFLFMYMLQTIIKLFNAMKMTAVVDNEQLTYFYYTLINIAGWVMIIVLLIAYFGFFYKIFARIIKICLPKRIKKQAHHQSFYSTLSQADREWFIAEEEYFRDTFGIRRASDDCLKKMKKAKPGRRLMIGTPFYDVLAIPSYRSSFEYFRGLASPPEEEAEGNSDEEEASGGGPIQNKNQSNQNQWGHLPRNNIGQDQAAAAAEWKSPSPSAWEVEKNPKVLHTPSMVQIERVDVGSDDEGILQEGGEFEGGSDNTSTLLDRGHTEANLRDSSIEDFEQAWLHELKVQRQRELKELADTAALSLNLIYLQNGQALNREGELLRESSEIN